jgi:hypothetical protein
MMRRKKTPPAGDKADKPGSRALQKLLDYFAHDANAARPVYPAHGTVGREGAELAQAALDHLAVGDAEQAVRCTVDAMLVYCNCEMIGLRFEHGDEMRDLAERWDRDTEPAVKREVARYKGKAKQRDKTKAKADAAIKDALKMIDGGRSKTDAQKEAAKQHKTSVTTVRKFWPKHLR